MNNLKNFNQNKIIITKNESSDIKIDNNIIPLFSSPVYLKEKSLKKRNKYNFTLTNPQKKLTYKVITFKEILSIFLKGFNIYNINLNKYLLSHKKLDLIEDIFLGKDQFYKLNSRLNKYLFILKKYLPEQKYNSFLYNVLLFFPKRLLKPQPFVRNSLRLRNFQQIFLLKKKDLIQNFNPTNSLTLDYNSLNNNLNLINRQVKIQRKRMRKILEIGKILLKDLNLAIIKKQALIKNLEISNKTEHVNYLNRSVDDINNVSIQKDKININSNLRERIKEKNILFNKQLFSSSLERTDNLEKDKLDTVPLLIQSLIRRKKLLSEETTSIEQGAYGSYLYGRFKEIAKNNQINIEESIKNISNNTSFLNKKDSSTRSSAPVSLFYYSNNLSASTTNSAISNKMVDQGSQASQDNLLVNIDSKPILNLYLKEMSTYNMVSKGIFINYSNIIGFNFNKGANKLYKNIYKLLASSFKSMYCLISKPVFIITPEKVIIQLFYFLFIPNILKLKKIYKYKNERAIKKMFKGREWFNRKKKLKKQYSKFRKIKLNVRIKLRNLSNITLTKIFSNKFKFLSLILNKFFKKPIEFDLIRLHYPYNDSNILVNLLGIMINKIKLRIIIRRLFERAVIKNLNKLSGNNVNIIPAFLSGITIRVAGRLLTHRVVPRQTVKTTRRGASAKGKINFKDIATYTNKNKRGAFSITVKSGQNFF